MSNVWSIVHHATKSGGGISIVEEYSPSFDSRVRFGYLLNYATRSYSGERFGYVEGYVYRNAKVVNSMNKTKHELRKILVTNPEIKYYSNFVVINDQTFNGVTKDMIKNLIKEIKEYRLTVREYELFGKED